MKIEHNTAASNLVALATVLTAMGRKPRMTPTVESEEDATRKAVLEAIKANAETLKDQEL